MVKPTVLDQPLIVRLLAERNLLSAEQQEHFSQESRRFDTVAEEAIANAGVVDERAIARAHAEHLGIPLVEVTRNGGVDRLVRVPLHGQPKELGDVQELVERCREVAERISESACRRNRVVPVGCDGGHLDLACLNPADITALDEVSATTGCVVRPHAAALGVLQTLTAELFGERDIVAEIAEEAIEGEGLHAGTPDGVVDLQRHIPVSKESQVLRYVNGLLAQAIEVGASDVHVEAYEGATRVRFRIDGRLMEVPPPPVSMFVATVSRIKILAKMDIAERRLPQDGAIAVRHFDRRVDLRVSTVPTVFGEKIVIRILEKGRIPGSLEELGFSDQQATWFVNAARAPHGLLFVTGPTGSGKSTTLYCCLNLINDPSENIVTVEDPVEYKFHGLNQVHVRPQVGLDFASALRAFLRQDPDKIMVGEVRDLETAQICMRAALTGHLVLSTLHTNSALQVVTRLVDMGVEPFLLGPALRLVEAQRLVRRLCPRCSEAYDLPDAVAERHGLPSGSRLHRPAGRPCDACRGTGFKGRVGLYEVIPITDRLSEGVSEGASQNELRKAARQDGLIFLEDDARTKLLEGVTSLEEVTDYIRVGF